MEIVKDVDGNEYHTVKIGYQVWTVENLKTTKYNDGAPIPLITDDNEWEDLTTPAYCWYNNDINNKEPYGALYNWYAVDTGKLAPEGWHVPTDEEWTTFSNYLGGREVAGGKLKGKGTEYWPFPNNDATDEVGFFALPGGYRYYYGDFYNLRNGGYWWSATESGASDAYSSNLYYNYEHLYNYYSGKSGGFSVRLVRD